MTAIAEAFVTLRPDTKNFAREAKGGIAGAFGPIGKAAAAGMAVVGAAIAGTAVAGIKAFAGFERGMNEVFTLLPGISGAAMDDMSDQVLKLSKDMGTLPEEVVPALYQALSAGVPQDNVFEFLEGANKAAIGGITDIETAVSAITGVVNAYGKDAITATEASDMMFTTVKLGVTTFGELAGSLSNVLPFAAAANVNFENISAAMATMTSVTGRTAESTTALRQLLVELADSGKGVGETFDAVHGKSFKDFMAEGGNMQRALGILADHADDTGLSIDQLFSSVEAGGAALILTGAASDSFTAALEQMGTSAGATQAAYDQMDQGMSRAMDKIRAGWEVLKIHIGEQLQPVVQRFADWLVTNMPMIEEKVTTFFNGVGLVAQAVADLLTGTTNELVAQSDIWNARLKGSEEVMDGWAVNAKENSETSVGAFQTVATFIKEDLQPAFVAFKDWWNNEGGETTFKAIGTTFGFIADQIADTIGEIKWILDRARDIKEAFASITDRLGGRGPDTQVSPELARRIEELANRKYHSGGIFGEGGTPFSGRLGPNEGLAVLERGEEILPVGHPRHARSGGGTTFNVTQNLYNPAPETPSESLPRSISRMTHLVGG